MQVSLITLFKFFFFVVHDPYFAPEEDTLSGEIRIVENKTRIEIR